MRVRLHEYLCQIKIKSMQLEVLYTQVYTDKTFHELYNNFLSKITLQIRTIVKTMQSLIYFISHYYQSLLTKISKALSICTSIAFVCKMNSGIIILKLATLWNIPGSLLHLRHYDTVRKQRIYIISSYNHLINFSYLAYIYRVTEILIAMFHIVFVCFIIFKIWVLRSSQD